METVSQSQIVKGLINVGVAIIRERNLNKISQMVAEAVVKHTTFQRSVVSLLEKNGTFKRTGFGGLTNEQIEQLKKMPPTTIEERKKTLQPDFLVGQSYYIPHDKADLEGLKSQQQYQNSSEWHPDDFLFIPLYNPEGDMVGMISVDDPRDGKRPTSESLLPLELLANITAVAVENANNVSKTEETLKKLKEQQKVVLELSTPVIQVWDKILVLPLIGTVDSVRAQQIMENILIRINQTESQIVIIDITGVPVIDTLVASHLVKTVAAVKLLGGEAIVTGINPEIAQTLVHLGVDLREVVTKANLARGVEFALRMTNCRIEKIKQ